MPGRSARHGPTPPRASHRSCSSRGGAVSSIGRRGVNPRAPAGCDAASATPRPIPMQTCIPTMALESTAGAVGMGVATDETRADGWSRGGGRRRVKVHRRSIVEGLRVTGRGRGGEGRRGAERGRFGDLMFPPKHRGEREVKGGAEILNPTPAPLKPNPAPHNYTQHPTP